MTKKRSIAVCIKQTPNTDKVKFDWKKGAIIRSNLENIINPEDVHAIEMALQIREQYGGSITVFTMGPPQAEDVLREAYGFGVDNCVLISDPHFAGSDTLITAKILALALTKQGPFDLIITGSETIDGNTGQVSYQLAEALNYPHLTKVFKIEIEENYALLERLYGHEYQKIKVALPILMSAQKDTNIPRFPNLLNIKKGFQKEISTLTMEDLGGSAEEYGFSASPTITIEGETFTHKRKREVFEGNTDEKIELFLQKLKKYEIIKM